MGGKMQNTIEAARNYYLNTLPESKYKNTLLELAEQGFEDTAKVKMTLTELSQLMVNYHNAIIQSKIEELEKEVELLDKQDKKLVLFKLLKRNFAINYLKVMKNESARLFNIKFK
jgi:hypothetical protein